MLRSWQRRAEQRAAKNEVLAAIRQNPVGGYGLYHLMDDAGLLTDEAKAELAPLVRSIERRLDLGEEAPAITLSLAFEPITDVEYDTLTSVIAQALRGFARKLPEVEEPLRLSALLGMNDLLARHATYTASIAYEVTLEELLLPLLRHYGAVCPYAASGGCDARPHDFFVAGEPRADGRLFPPGFADERRLAGGEIVVVDEVWPEGYLRARRLTHTAAYTHAWLFRAVRRTLPQDPRLAVVHRREGTLYRLAPRNASAVTRFIDLYRKHLVDHSADPTVYQPKQQDG